MRVYAAVVQRVTEQRLIAVKPASPDQLATPTVQFPPADGQPATIRLPALDLWNNLQPVNQQITWRDGRLSHEWGVTDAGWHAVIEPGWKQNVVLDGHSPSLDPATWTRSIFRQLAYLNPGDPIELSAGSRIYTYTVERVFAVPASEAETPEAERWLAPGNAERLTLVTCWPPQTAAYRVIVIAQPFSVKERTYHGIN